MLLAWTRRRPPRKQLRRPPSSISLTLDTFEPIHAAVCGRFVLSVWMRTCYSRLEAFDSIAVAVHDSNRPAGQPASLIWRIDHSVGMAMSYAPSQMMHWLNSMSSIHHSGRVADAACGVRLRCTASAVALEYGYHGAIAEMSLNSDLRRTCSCVRVFVAHQMVLDCSRIPVLSGMVYNKQKKGKWNDKVGKIYTRNVRTVERKMRNTQSVKCNTNETNTRLNDPFPLSP